MIIRDLKLDIVLSNQNLIIDKFNEMTKDLKVIKTNVYNNDDTEFIFYNQNNKWIFYQDLKNGNFWCNNKRYWSFFEDEFNLEYQEIQGLTKYLVEEILKVKVGTPQMERSLGVQVVEETLKVKVGTPKMKELIC